MMMKVLLQLNTVITTCVSLFILTIILFHQSHAFSTSNTNQPPDLPTTSAVLRVTYDGTLFHGWTAGNTNNNADDLSTRHSGVQSHQLNKRGRSRRNRNRPSIRKGEIRSVQNILRCALAKIYGNVGMDRIVVEGSSRTDAGVSARNMVALIYCLHDNYVVDSDEDSDADADAEVGKDDHGKDQHPKHLQQYTGTLAIEGKRLPHPISPYDEGFKPLPFKSDLKQMIYALNKMLPPDVRISDASYTPTKNGGHDELSKPERPFHPSLDAISKTYSYTFSIGEVHDPIRSRNVWHVPNTKSSSFDLQYAIDCASILCGRHDFKPFRGAFRGNERGKVQDTICTVSSITIEEEAKNEYARNTVYASSCCRTYKVTIVGDRFLYKMVRFLVGFIVFYGTNSKTTSLQQVHDILSKGEWDDVPRICAPAYGLILEQIEYGNDLEFNWIVS